LFRAVHLETGPIPSNVNISFKDNVKSKSKKEVVKDDDSEDDDKEEEKDDLNKNIYKFLMEIKEPVVIIFLFILLNNEELIMMIGQIPYFNKLPEPYPSLILRGSIMALLIYNLKKYSK
jgi:hypothetical protein